ncbi:hypothetical protein HDU96_008722 [Phlyctochytrium bullatum]|nr:hypothetical protein HDU96_008722 [Phlyctochytrium bullatum]
MHVSKRVQVLLIALAAVCMLVIVVSVVGVFNQREGKLKRSKDYDTYVEGKTTFPEATTDEDAEVSFDGTSFSSEDLNASCRYYTYLLVKVGISNLDLVATTYKLKLDLFPCGDLLRVNGSSLRTYRRPIKLIFGEWERSHSGLLLMTWLTRFLSLKDSKVFNFSSNSVVGSVEYGTTFDEGDVNSYPFDSFYARELFAEGTYVIPSGNTTVEEPLPIVMSFVTGLQTFTVTPNQVEDVTPNNTFLGHTVRLEFQVTRSITTIFFSTLVMVIMWILSLLAFFLCISLWIRGRKVEPPTIAFTIALLFALPGIRNTQPGSPPIGCTADVVSFFWAMVLVATSVALLMINYILKYNFDGIDILAPKEPAKPSMTQDQFSVRAIPA